MRVKRAPRLAHLLQFQDLSCVLPDQLMDKIIRTESRFITFKKYEHRAAIIIDNTNRNE